MLCDVINPLKTFSLEHVNMLNFILIMYCYKFLLGFLSWKFCYVSLHISSWNVPVVAIHGSHERQLTLESLERKSWASIHSMSID